MTNELIDPYEEQDKLRNRMTELSQQADHWQRVAGMAEDSCKECLEHLRGAEAELARYKAMYDDPPALQAVWDALDKKDFCLAAELLRPLNGNGNIPTIEAETQLSFFTMPFSPDTDTIPLVKDFMQAAGQQVLPSPGQPDTANLKLRLSLELEELYEKAQAMGLEGTFQDMLYDKATEKPCTYGDGGINERDTNSYDPVALLDACLDQRYVQDGTVLACGLQDAFYEGFEEVQRSNMSKFCSLDTIAKRTEEKYAAEGIATTTKVHDSNGDTAWYGIVCRASDGKILKSIDYSPANLAPILAKHTASAPSSED